MQPQNAFVSVRSWTWTSSPMTGWYFAKISGASAVIVDIFTLILAISRQPAGRGFGIREPMRTSYRRKPPQPEPNQGQQKHLERPSAQDIYEQVANNARQELGRSNVSLAISGFAGGIFMGLSALGNAIA